ncbi:hypothetical protein L228DRAFT_266513 [Xylona heveae TC161]|uniref:C2H2-type domain-containing protein n=1 Tax=Xylona heveae (strain CBS 132557 / TC161) TaxID=1328760 RepID=A0A165HZV2_XYLHT|nr:hypothetical protein L228DRAFT_266513 [Xylona heveae TC161]KZF24153.1 hypothetical protein L228DRAFT_266513 [Xylona heveae TC161]
MATTAETAHAAPTASAIQPVVQQSIKDETLSCQWAGCGEKAQTPEQLYDHVCERHVGRKSTNNLNLTCQWGTCRTTTVKRDHITSHIRVHVPLKPHKCDFCGKAFKRPQDLKKHVKTHADDSVLLRSPDPAAGRHRDLGYRMDPTGKLNNELQALAATASGYYDTSMHTGYGHAPSATGGGYYAAQAPSSSTFGPVYYSLGSTAEVGNAASYETRKRGLDALNEFFGDAKRRQIDPNSYAEVGHRLTSLQGVPLSLQNGAFASEYHHVPSPVAASAGGQGPVLHHQYSLPPMPNLRTKSDLLNVDQFLEQMQATVYESSNQAAAAGVAQPGVHYVHGGLNFRQSHSPPQAPAHTALHTGSSHAANAPSTHSHVASGASAQGGTPALTPASSAMSYTSGHSPSSAHSGHRLSPLPRESSSSMYPHLPAVSASGDASSGYSAPMTGHAPASTLGTMFEEPRRRFSGGTLQAASRPSRSDGSRSPSEEVATPPARETNKESGNATSSVIDPALAEAAQSPTTQSETAEDRAQESWVENIRTIEALRNIISAKLQHREYEEEDEPMADREPTHEDEVRTPTGHFSRDEDREMTEAERDAQSLYPVLREVGAAD